MNLTTLKETCAAYHGVELADLTKGSSDLFLVAANNAKTKAQKRHDFEYAKCTASLDVDSVNGGPFSTAVITPPDVFSGIAKIVEVSGVRLGGDFVPLDFGTPVSSIERDRTEIDVGTDFLLRNRYPSDAQFEARIGNYSLVQRGSALYRFPRTTTVEASPLTVYLECFGWLKDYTQAQVTNPDATSQDFLLEFGFEYLQWTIIIELNYIFKSFVPRQEGNLSSPENMQTQAWKDLLVWDAYLVEPQITRD